MKNGFGIIAYLTLGILFGLGSAFFLLFVFLSNIDTTGPTTKDIIVNGSISLVLGILTIGCLWRAFSIYRELK